MLTTLNVNTNNLNISKTSLEQLINTILEDYTDFDIELMKKYVETKDLEESNFVNI